MEKTAHPKQRGQCSEAAILFEFTRRGVTVLEPFGDNERYDFVVEISRELYRVQVKTGRLTNRSTVRNAQFGYANSAC